MRTVSCHWPLPLDPAELRELLLGRGSEPRRVAQAESLQTALADFSGGDWAHLSRELRSQLVFKRGLRPWRVKPLDADQLLRRMPRPRLGWRLLAMARSGYLRQRALQELDADPRGDELPLLLLLANDHVTGIREQARAALERRLLPRHLRRFLKLWALVVRLEPRLRNACRFEDLASPEAGDDGLRIKITRMAMSGIDTGALSDGFASASSFPRRSAFALAFEAAGTPQLPWILGAALESSDPVVQRAALHHVPSLGDRESTAALLDIAARSASPVLRLAALEVWLDLYPEAAPLERMSLDPSARLRRAARDHLSRRGTFDLAELARAAIDGRLAAPPFGSPAGSLSGHLRALGETGDSADLDRLRPFLTHPSARVRRAAAEAMASIGARRNR